MEKAIVLDLLSVLGATILTGWIFHLLATLYQTFLFIRSKRPATRIYWFPVAVILGSRFIALIFSLGIEDNWPKDIVPIDWLIFYWPAFIAEIVVTPLSMKLSGFRNLSIFPLTEEKNPRPKRQKAA